MDTFHQGSEGAGRRHSVGRDGPFVVEAVWDEDAPGGPGLLIQKHLSEHWACPTESLNAFLGDVQRLQRISHPHLLGILEVQLDGQGLHLTTEHLRAIPLSLLSGHRSPAPAWLSLEQVVLLFYQAVQGLKAAHLPEQGLDGIVHGALSPEHVLVTVDGGVKLKNFGIYRLGLLGQCAESSRWESEFSSPEQEAGLPPDFRSDVFALGRIVQGLLGQCRQVQEGKPIPVELLELVHCCLDRNPEVRYPSAVELLHALQFILSDILPDPSAVRLDEWVWSVLRSGEAKNSEALSPEALPRGATGR